MSDRLSIRLRVWRRLQRLLEFLLGYGQRPVDGMPQLGGCSRAASQVGNPYAFGSGAACAVEYDGVSGQLKPYSPMQNAECRGMIEIDEGCCGVTADWHNTFLRGQSAALNLSHFPSSQQSAVNEFWPGYTPKSRGAA